MIGKRPWSLANKWLKLRITSPDTSVLKLSDAGPQAPRQTQSSACSTVSRYGGCNDAATPWSTPSGSLKAPDHRPCRRDHPGTAVGDSPGLLHHARLCLCSEGGTGQGARPFRDIASHPRGGLAFLKRRPGAWRVDRQRTATLGGRGSNGSAISRKSRRSAARVCFCRRSSASIAIRGSRSPTVVIDGVFDGTRSYEGGGFGEGRLRPSSEFGLCL